MTFTIADIEGSRELIRADGQSYYRSYYTFTLRTIIDNCSETVLSHGCLQCPNKLHAVTRACSDNSPSLRPHTHSQTAEHFMQLIAQSVFKNIH
jgi:hypothetical protein